MAAWTGSMLFSLALLTCFSVSAAGEYCAVGGYGESTFCDNGCCHDDDEYDSSTHCCPSSVTVGLAIGCSVGGLLILLVLVCACRYAYYKRRLERQRVIVGRLDITVVRTIQHPGYGYDQPALPEQLQASSLGRQSATGTPPNQGGPPTPLQPTGQQAPRPHMAHLLRILQTAPLPPRSTTTPPTTGLRP